MKIQPSRIESLDVLRGLAILGMALSAFVPFGVLPAWMYHAQTPPPDHFYRADLAGITWVDLVFPFFLFAMGASIPLTWQRAIEQPIWSQIGKVIYRFLALVGLAILSQHLRPDGLGSPKTPEIYVWSLFGFLVLIGLYWRATSLGKGNYMVNAFSALGVLAIFLDLDGRLSLQVDRYDVILLVLANVSLSGTLIYLVTRRWPLFRFIPILAITMVLLTMNLGGVGQAVWEWTPLPWLYHFEFHKYLLVVLPGTLVGELLLREQVLRQSRVSDRLIDAAILLLSIAVVAGVVVGLQARETELTTRLAASAGLVVCALAWFVRGRSRLQFELAIWGLAWLLIGLIAEPYQGGIRKDGPTLSYFFVTGGLAIYTLVAINCLHKLANLRLMSIALIGQNPILGYLSITNLIPALMSLSGLDAFISLQNLTPWSLVAVAAGKTAIVGLVAALFSGLRIYLRA